MERLSADEKYIRLSIFLILWREKIVEPYEDERSDALTPTQFYGLCAVKYYGQMTMTALSAAMHMSKQNSTKLADRLVELAYVERNFDEKDRRVIRLRISEKGAAYLEKSLFSRTQRLVAKMEQLSQKDQDEFFRCMDTMSGILEKMTSGKA